VLLTNGRSRSSEHLDGLNGSDTSTSTRMVKRKGQGQPDPEDSVPPRQMGSDHGPLEDQELMAEREVLERDAGSPGGEGT
jgi:hypothetical protein